jgi:hypothetical protein
MEFFGRYIEVTPHGGARERRRAGTTSGTVAESGIRRDNSQFEMHTIHNDTIARRPASGAA